MRVDVAAGAFIESVGFGRAAAGAGEAEAYFSILAD